MYGRSEAGQGVSVQEQFRAPGLTVVGKTGAIHVRVEIRGGGTGRQTTLVNFRSCVTSDQNTLTPPNFHNAPAIIFLTE